MYHKNQKRIFININLQIFIPVLILLVIGLIEKDKALIIVSVLFCLFMIVFMYSIYFILFFRDKDKEFQVKDNCIIYKSKYRQAVFTKEDISDILYRPYWGMPYSYVVLYLKGMDNIRASNLCVDYDCLISKLQDWELIK
ncbi:MAG: hypothetical protein KA792_04455 [Bacteroidales bacterium]|nr:hypothetical protein [Bacteroidales bacterium]